MTDMDIDSLCNTMTNASVKYDINTKLIKDLDTIINDIIESGTFDRDIYDICVNCGHDLTWDQEYIIYQADIDWLKKDGLQYFFKSINDRKPILTEEDYHKVWYLFKSLYDLFCLQITSE